MLPNIGILSLLLLWSVTLVVGQGSNENGYRPLADPNVCSPESCRLPACFCAGTDAPMRMSADVIPQIVMFTFDDAVNQQVMTSLGGGWSVEYLG